MKTFRMQGIRDCWAYGGRLPVYLELRAKNQQEVLRIAQARGVENARVLSDSDIERLYLS